MAIKTKKIEVPDKVYEHKTQDKKLELYREQHPIDPRTHGAISTMVCSHSRYNLGDKEPETSKHNNWSGIKKEIKERHDVKAILPLYLYDHSGITISTTPFSSGWDSGQVGFIYLTQEQIEKRGIKEEHRTQENYRQWLKDEVETYDQFLRGDVWRFELYQNGEEVDSCGGFYNQDHIFESAGVDPEEYERGEE